MLFERMYKKIVASLNIEHRMPFRIYQTRGTDCDGRLLILQGEMSFLRSNDTVIRQEAARELEISLGDLDLAPS